MTSLQSLSDEDRFRYHAYNYGWHAAVQGRHDRREPLDPEGDWYVANMADRAEDYHRKRLGMKPVRHTRPQMPGDPATVRANWRQLHLRDLTQAERALAVELVDEPLRRFRSENPRAAAQMEELIGDPFAMPPAPEIPPP